MTCVYCKCALDGHQYVVRVACGNMAHATPGDCIARLTRERDEAVQRAEAAERERDEVSIAEVALDVDYEALRGRYMAWQARAEAAERERDEARKGRDEAAERRAAEERAAIVAWLRAQASEEVCGDFFADVIHSFVAHCIAGIECGEHNKQNEGNE